MCKNSVSDLKENNYLSVKATLNGCDFQRLDPELPPEIQSLATRRFAIWIFDLLVFYPFSY